ncbi:MAG TPA: type II toxin-antitoxin system RelE/ParE family toxin [Acidobacteriaceae bacterium]
MRVIFSPAAENDFAEIEEYLALRFSPRNANRFVQRIVRECLSLAHAPQRGNARDDIRPGVRTIGFERRASIVFEVNEVEIIILGVYYGDRQFDVTG